MRARAHRRRHRRHLTTRTMSASLVFGVCMRARLFGVARLESSGTLHGQRENGRTREEWRTKHVFAAFYFQFFLYSCQGWSIWTPLRRQWIHTARWIELSGNRCPATILWQNKFHCVCIKISIFILCAAISLSLSLALSQLVFIAEQWIDGWTDGWKDVRRSKLKP